MAYLEILAPASTVESSVSIALGTATVISASVLTVRMLNDNGTLDTGSSATVALTQQGIGSVIFGSAASTSLTLSSGVATTALRGKYGGVVEFIATASGAGNGGKSITVTANTQLGGNARPPAAPPATRDRKSVV